MSSRLVKICYQ